MNMDKLKVFETTRTYLEEKAFGNGPSRGNRLSLRFVKSSFRERGVGCTYPER